MFDEKYVFQDWLKFNKQTPDQDLKVLGAVNADHNCSYGALTKLPENT